MKDMNNNPVSNGDFMMETHEDHAYIFRVIDNKLNLCAFLSLGQLKKFTMEDANGVINTTKKWVKRNVMPAFMVKYYQDRAYRLENMKPESLMKVFGVNERIFTKFVEEGYQVIEYDNKLNNTLIAYFDDEEIIGSYSSEVREMTKEERDELENIINTKDMKMYKCKCCDEWYASTLESLKDGYCGICEMELSQELKDSHGLEGRMEDDE